MYPVIVALIACVSVICIGLLVWKLTIGRDASRLMASLRQRYETDPEVTRAQVGHMQRFVKRHLPTIMWRAHTAKKKLAGQPACPGCGEPLATKKAQQCFSCGLNWHGKSRPDAVADPVKHPNALEEMLRKMWERANWVVTWSEEKQWAGAGLDQEDAELLKAAIRSVPNVGHHVIHAGRGDAGLSLLTSNSASPKAKRGDALIATRNRNGWTIERVGGWKQNLHKTMIVMGVPAGVV